MVIQEAIHHNIARISLNGRFDAHTCAAVDSHLRKKVDSGIYQLILDMKDVPFIASAGLRVILVYAKELRQRFKGDLRIAALQSNVSKVFEIAGLNNVIQIFDTPDAANQSFLNVSG